MQLNFSGETAPFVKIIPGTSAINWGRNCGISIKYPDNRVGAPQTVTKWYVDRSKIYNTFWDPFFILVMLNLYNKTKCSFISPSTEHIFLYQDINMNLICLISGPFLDMCQHIQPIKSDFVISCHCCQIDQQTSHDWNLPA